MAKRGSRDTTVSIASDPLRVLAAPVSPTPLRTWNPYADLQTLSEVEDHRQWTPYPGEAIYSPRGVRVKSRLRDSGVAHRRFGAQTKAIRVFSNPDPTRSAIICVRRHARREVLHALKKLNRRGSGGGKPRRTWKSRIKC